MGAYEEATNRHMIAHERAQSAKILGRVLEQIELATRWPVQAERVTQFSHLGEPNPHLRQQHLDRAHEKAARAQEIATLAMGEVLLGAPYLNVQRWLDDVLLLEAEIRDLCGLAGLQASP